MIRTFITSLIRSFITFVLNTTRLGF